MKTPKTLLTAGAITAFSLSLAFGAEQQHGQSNQERSSSALDQEQESQVESTQEQEIQVESEQERQLEFGSRPESRTQQSTTQRQSRTEQQTQVKMGQQQQTKAHKISELKGSRVQSSDGERLGTIEDIVIDLQTGELSYIVVSSGGFLGIGGDWKPIPPESIQVRQADRGLEVTLDVTQQQWEEAPTVERGEIAQLSQEQRSREIYQFYGADFESRQQARLSSTRSSTRMETSQRSGQQAQQGQQQIEVHLRQAMVQAGVDEQQARQESQRLARELSQEDQPEQQQIEQRIQQAMTRAGVDRQQAEQQSQQVSQQVHQQLQQSSGRSQFGTPPRAREEGPGQRQQHGVKRQREQEQSTRSQSGQQQDVESRREQQQEFGTPPRAREEGPGERKQHGVKSQREQQQEQDTEGQQDQESQQEFGSSEHREDQRVKFQQTGLAAAQQSGLSQEHQERGATERDTQTRTEIEQRDEQQQQREFGARQRGETEIESSVEIEESEQSEQQEFGASQRDQQPSAQTGQSEGQARLADDLMDVTITNQEQEEIGQIDDILVDLQSGEIQFVLIKPETGFWETADDTYAVAPQSFQLSGEDEITLNITQQDLEQAETLSQDEVQQQSQQTSMAGTDSSQSPQVFRYEAEEEDQGGLFGGRNRDDQESEADADATDTSGTRDQSTDQSSWQEDSSDPSQNR